MPESKTMIIHGKTLVPGLGRGETYAYSDILKQVDEFYDIESEQIDQELRRFSDALEHISGELDDLANKVKEEMDPDLANIFSAHAIIVQDDSLKEEVEKEIRDEQVSAGAAVRKVFERWEKRFRSMEADVAQQKGDDLRDLTRRLITSLAGIRSHELENLPEGCVIVANRLLPSDTIFLARRNASAAILEEGGAGSHAALFAHEIGLPCITGIHEQIPSGQLALVDATAAEIIINPKAEEEEEFEVKCREQEKASEEALRHAHEPAETQGGTRIKVLANVGGVDDAKTAIENGAEGIGLYRIEQVYLGRSKPPDVDELLAEMRQTLEPAAGLPVYVRLLDAGADKTLPFMEHLSEENPSLGLRGVRLLKEYPELMNTQLEALLKLASDYDLHIVVPMVTLPSDMLWAREQLEEASSDMGIANMPKLGAMIETPAAALSAPRIAEHADFLSIGTNDLTQYLFAADRENAAVDEYFDDTNEVVFQLMKIIHESVPDVPLSICGELAGRAGHVEKILQCGIETLSVAPPSIPRVKQEIRQVASV